ncbi:hypothetical protein [Campylobacter troglodytis]|uniref:hypothetical protein n=1 Tax=Campylobacter troglodytis TaxID=654363 RepID=UPI0011599AFA|nr:hypothetical protein [Campylobacter troglodytis]TQR61058.1 hypothetical protein DMC01_02685 [Campylobacter troglodytis]
MYFSYGKEMIKLEGDDSRHSSDLNLHINTSGYEDGEMIRLNIEFNKQNFNIQVGIRNKEAIIMNILHKE